MRPNILSRISFLSLFLVIVLIPLFFLPFTKIPVEVSKGLLLVVGLVVTILFWTMGRFSEGSIVLPRSFLLLSAFGIVVAFSLSAMFSSSSQMSFFGIMFDTGSFWYIFSVFILMLLASIMVRDARKAENILWGVVCSSALILVFQAVRLFYPHLALGTLNVNDVTDNIIGSWNAFGIFAGFVSIMSLFLIEFFSFSMIRKFFLSVLMLLSLFLMAVVNSPLVWTLVGFFALLIFVYKISFSFTARQDEGARPSFPVISFGLIVISILFFMTPQSIGGYLPNHFHLSNIEVSPSFSATVTIAKGVIMHHPIFGLGPNRFGDAWAMYKSGASINPTVFWDTHFDFGSGLWPTFAATTGIIGIFALLVFFFLFILTGIRALLFSVRNGMSQIMLAFLLAALYFIVASIFYTTGVVVLILSFAFIGIFIGLFSASSSYGEVVMEFSNSPRKSFLSLLVLVLIMIVTAVFGFKYIEHFSSLPYFEKGISTQDITVAEPAIVKANTLSTNDLYLRTYSQVYLFKFNNLVAKGNDLSDADKATLQTDLTQAQNGAQSAVFFNKDNYQNYQALGDVYNTAGASGVPQAYDKALTNYQSASALNPANPGLKLTLARVYFADSKITEAKDFAHQALTLKPDYIDALVFLSQVAKSEGSSADAISFATQALSYAEQALASNPNNSNLIQNEKTLSGYVDSLKNPASPSPSTDTSKSSSTTSKTTTTKKTTN